MLTTRQIELVQDSFAGVAAIAPVAAAEFYRRLFNLAPETRTLFRHDMDDQGRKLFLTLALVVDSLDRFEDVVPVAQQLAIRHVGYGAKEGHYRVVGQALIETLRIGLGPAFDEPTERAWVAAYTLLSDVMLSAVRQPA